MNEEIKLSKSEIIGICEFLKIHHFENSYLLLDYITNLQQENERLQENLITTDNLRMYYKSKYKELKEMIK